jgi:hypothetical protein
MEMRHGERVFCRYEEELGSRVGGRKICGSADQLLGTQRAAKESVEQIQQRQHNRPRQLTRRGRRAVTPS